MDQGSICSHTSCFFFFPSLVGVWVSAQRRHSFASTGTADNSSASRYIPVPVSVRTIAKVTDEAYSSITHLAKLDNASRLVDLDLLLRTRTHHEQSGSSACRHADFSLCSLFCLFLKGFRLFQEMETKTEHFLYDLRKHFLFLFIPLLIDWVVNLTMKQIIYFSISLIRASVIGYHTSGLCPY